MTCENCDAYRANLYSIRDEIEAADDPVLREQVRGELFQALAAYGEHVMTGHVGNAKGTDPR